MTDIICPSSGDLVETEIGRIATQYREANKFVAYMRASLGGIEDAALATCRIPEFFDLKTARGEQLTLLGKVLGWPRCHCVCDASPVFGFNEENGAASIRISGLCDEGTWLDCNDAGTGEICIADDEIYRGFLKARRYQMLGLYDIASLTAAAICMWGKTASIVDSGFGYVVVSPGRELTDFEERALPLAFRVLPIAPGIRARVVLGAGPIFGIGAGWGGFCQGSRWLCPTDPHAYDCD